MHFYAFTTAELLCVLAAPFALGWVAGWAVRAIRLEMAYRRMRKIGIKHGIY